MKRLHPETPELKSSDLVAENIELLRELFPEAFANEGKIDFDVFRQLLGDRVDGGEERYGLNWHGKRAARQLALTPSTGSLRPCPEESVDWDTTQNIFIEGDNLEVLKLLQKSYAGKVKLIYIDPPYNTGKDFVYPDNFQDSIKNYLEITGQLEGGQKVTSNTEASGRFHTDWLNMMYPRLKLARALMREDGLIFISVDSGELCNVVLLMNEIFGEDNLVGQLIWKKSYGGGAKTKHVVILHDYVLCYSRNKEKLPRIELPPDPAARRYYKHSDSKCDTRGPYRLQPLATNSNDERPNLRYGIPWNGEEVWPEKQWQWEKTRVIAALENDELVFTQQGGQWSVNYKQYLRDESGVERGAKPFSILEGPYTQVGTGEIAELLGDPKVFSFPKPVGLLSVIVRYCHPDADFLCVDFFAGSGTTGHALMEENAATSGKRRFLLVQLPEPLDGASVEAKAAFRFCEKMGRSPNIAEITKERLREAAKQIHARHPASPTDLGFRVFKLDTGNVRPWEASRDTLAAALTAAVDHVKPDRSEDDLLYDIILKHGLDLCSAIEEKQIGSHKVRAVGGGAVFACLGSQIAAVDVEQLADGIAEWRDELAPANPELSRVVFRDSAFETDVAKTNLALILKERGFDEKLLVSL
jgi:adenine-specific DNA-methyltransferase